MNLKAMQLRITVPLKETVGLDQNRTCARAHMHPSATHTGGHKTSLVGPFTSSKLNGQIVKYQQNGVEVESDFRN